MQASSDAALDAAIAARLVATTGERAWKITSRPACGRYLVAARDLAAGEVVFAERPLIVATSTSDGERAMRGEMAAVALELLREPSDSPAHLLQEADLSADTECASMINDRGSAFWPLLTCSARSMLARVCQWLAGWWAAHVDARRAARAQNALKTSPPRRRLGRASDRG